MSGLRDWMEGVRAERGRLTPKLVLEAARAQGPELCPVYDRFKFDDDADAAERYRLSVAHEAIREVRVTYKPRDPDAMDEKVRYYHAVRSDEAGEPYVYEPIEDVAADPRLSELVLREAEREWKQLRARYGHLREFIDIVATDLHSNESAAA